MSHDKANLSRVINKRYLDKKGSHFVCPDGNPRKLAYVDVQNDTLKLEFQGIRPDVAAYPVNWPVHEADTRFSQYTPISATQAQKYKDAGTLVLVTESGQQTLSVLEEAKLLFDPNDDLSHITAGLRAAFDKVQTTPGFIPQAQAANDIGKTIIDAHKVKASIIKTIVDARNGKSSPL